MPLGTTESRRGRPSLRPEPASAAGAPWARVGSPRHAAAMPAQPQDRQPPVFAGNVPASVPTRPEAMGSHRRSSQLRRWRRQDPPRPPSPSGRRESFSAIGTRAATGKAIRAMATTRQRKTRQRGLALARAACRSHAAARTAVVFTSNIAHAGASARRAGSRAFTRRPHSAWMLGGGSDDFGGADDRRASSGG